MSNHQQINLLVNWIQDFDPTCLRNEDDVETKFVLQLFKLLGYLDEYRRGKYPLTMYNPSTRGRKLEIDYVYFSTNEDNKQQADTCLIIVEAKKPGENLDQALQQALLYGSYLEPILYVMTNGTQIKVVKRKRFRGQEIVFDDIVNLLGKREIAEKFYRQLNFNTVKNLNENIANVLSHEQYVLLDESLRRHPDIREILDKGDFTPEVKQEPRKLTVVKPKVAISCTLPRSFNEGSCQIEFSSVTLRGLTLKVNHSEIIGNLITGLNTKPEWTARRFIKSTTNETYGVSFGNASFILSSKEASELCDCIDEVFSVYKNLILEDEQVLECRDFDYVPIKARQAWGFRLFSVKKRLWELMYSFANHFFREEVDWDFFYSNRRALDIRYGMNNCALVQPQASYLSSDYLDLIYQIPEKFVLDDIERSENTTSWRDGVGTEGLWTVKYTKQWLLNTFIPKTINFFKQNHKRLLDAQCKYYVSLLEKVDISDYDDYSYEWDIDEDVDDRVPLQEANNLKYLVPYVEDIQSWLYDHRYNISAFLLRSYYKVFTELSKKSNSTSVDLNYIAENIGAIERKIKGERIEGTEWTGQRVLNSLQYHVERIDAVEFEEAEVADLMSRTFIAILKDWDVHCSQADLNIAKQALFPLWKESRFEERYVLPYLNDI